MALFHVADAFSWTRAPSDAKMLPHFSGAVDALVPFRRQKAFRKQPSLPAVKRSSPQPRIDLAAILT